MFRVLKLVICILFIAFCLWACSGESDPSIMPEQTQWQTLSDDQRPIDQEGPNWRSFGGGIWDYIVYDNKGNEILREYGTPIFTMIDENLLRVDRSGGTATRLTQFFDVELGFYSPEYTNILALDFGRIVYLDQNDPEWNTLVVHDMFDPEKNRFYVVRDLRLNRYDDYVAVEFIDEHHLIIDYRYSEDGRVKETVELR